MRRMTPIVSPLAVMTVKPTSNVMMTPSLNIIGKKNMAMRFLGPTPNVLLDSSKI